MENKSGSSTTTPSSQQSSASGSMAGQKFVNAQTGDQWLGSDLIGMKVTGSGNENIGTISDLLVDKDGRVMAAVIGVGGFLGIGQKDVAVSFDSLKLQRNADGNEQATLTLTKAELESAPDFKEFERPAAARPSGTSSSPSGSTPGMTKPGSK
jgi:hypothetical protein